jgi:hypothetical protein
MCKIKRWRSAQFQPTAPLQLQCVCGLEKCPKTAPNLTRKRYAQGDLRPEINY